MDPFWKRVERKNGWSLLALGQLAPNILFSFLSIDKEVKRDVNAASFRWYEHGKPQLAASIKLTCKAPLPYLLAIEHGSIFLARDKKLASDRPIGKLPFVT